MSLSEKTELRMIGVPSAVIRGVQDHYGRARYVPPRIVDLVRLTAVQVMEMDSVGWRKLQDTRVALAVHGYTLRLDPPLPVPKPEVKLETARDREVESALAALEEARREIERAMILLSSNKPGDDDNVRRLA